MKPFLTIEFTSRPRRDTQIISCNVQEWEPAFNENGLAIYSPARASQAKVSISLQELQCAHTPEHLISGAVQRVWLQAGKYLFPELFEGKIPEDIKR